MKLAVKVYEAVIFDSQVDIITNLICDFLPNAVKPVVTKENLTPIKWPIVKNYLLAILINSEAVPPINEIRWIKTREYSNNITEILSSEEKL